MKVELKDRKSHIEDFRMALAMCEVNTNYQTCELILTILEEVNLRGGGFSLIDAARIRNGYETKWNEYQKQQNEKQNEKTT